MVRLHCHSRLSVVWSDSFSGCREGSRWLLPSFRVDPSVWEGWKLHLLLLAFACEFTETPLINTNGTSHHSGRPLQKEELVSICVEPLLLFPHWWLSTPGAISSQALE